MYTLNLDDYKKMVRTDSCYLDGRYFYRTLVNYPGTIPEPLSIFIADRKKKKTGKLEEDFRLAVNMKASQIDTQNPGLLRVVIQTPHSRHCNLLILDYSNGTVYRFEPLGRKAPYFEEINKIIEGYLSFFFEVKLEVMDINVDSVLDEKNPSCSSRGVESGFCTAYIIMFAYAYVNGKDFDFTEVRRFAKKIETEYGTLPMEGKEIEYGLFDRKGYNPDPGKMALGGVVGLGVGGLAAGGTGAAIGGLTGIGIGSLF